MDGRQGKAAILKFESKVGQDWDRFGVGGGVWEFLTGQSGTRCQLGSVGPVDFIVGSADLHFEDSCTFTGKCSLT